MSLDKDSQLFTAGPLTDLNFKMKVFRRKESYSNGKLAYSCTNRGYSSSAFRYLSGFFHHQEK
jgi:hypothetical protein